MTSLSIKNKVWIVFVVLCSSTPLSVGASEVSGTISENNKFTKICKNTLCDSFGVLNFKPTINSNTPGAISVQITDTGIVGHIWGSEIGWINMNPSGAGVLITPATGALSGKAYASTGSWINFSPTYPGHGPAVGVTLVDNGSGSDFSGWAWVSGPNGGWVKFDCTVANLCIKTDWRSVAYRSNYSASGGGGIGYSAPDQLPLIAQPKSVSQPQISIQTKNSPSSISIPNIFYIPGLWSGSTGIEKIPLFTGSKENINSIQTDSSIPIITRSGISLPAYIVEEINFSHRQVFPVYKNAYSVLDCLFCIVYRKDIQKIESLSVDSIQKRTEILKFGFVPKRMETPFKFKRKTENKKPREVYIDLTSVAIAAGATTAFRRFLIGFIRMVMFR